MTDSLSALDGIDWNDAARQTVLAGLGMIPEVGGLVSALAGVLWPEGGDVWSQIRQRVEELVDGKIAEYAYKDVQAALDGLQLVIAQYHTALANKGSRPDYKLTVWVATYTQFLQFKPKFQLPGYELLLLPLFAQFSNLRLALLRDVVQAGQDWGLDADNIATRKAELAAAIKDAVAYADKTEADGLAVLVANTPRDDKHAQPFRALNAFSRGMTLLVRDFSITWPYFDPSAFPPPVMVELDREIYSDPYGSCDGSGHQIQIPPPPTGNIRGMSVWGGDRIDAIQVAYTQAGGAGSGGDTGRMGGPNGSNLPPRGGRFPVAADNPITEVWLGAGDVVMWLKFNFLNGSATRMFGAGGGNTNGFSIPGHMLTSVYVNGVAPVYQQSIECLVFGFKFIAAGHPAAAIVNLFFITSPGHQTVGQLAQSLRLSGPIADEAVLHPQRDAFGARMQALAS